MLSDAAALARVGDFAAFLGQDFDEALGYAALRKAGRRSSRWLAEGIPKSVYLLIDPFGRRSRRDDGNAVWRMCFINLANGGTGAVKAIAPMAMRPH